MVKVSREDILILTPFKILYNILGTPTFVKMINLQKQFGANIIFINCPLGKSKRQLGLLKYPTKFAVQNNGLYDPPNQQPPTYPNIHAGTSTANREHMHAKPLKINKSGIPTSTENISMYNICL